MYIDNVESRWGCHIRVYVLDSAGLPSHPDAQNFASSDDGGQDEL